MTDSILFLFLSMVIIAASLYLPEHVAVIARRAYYYAVGDKESTVQKVSQTMAETVAQTAFQAASSIAKAATSMPTTAQEVVESATAVAEAVAGEL